MSEQGNSEPDAADESSGDIDTLATELASSIYKVRGSFSDQNGAGVLGENTAESGTPIGVEGAVPNAGAGYGLSTPQDARVSGTLETSGLAGSLTGGTTLSSLTGTGLQLDGNALALAKTVRETARTFSEAGLTVATSSSLINEGAIEMIGPAVQQFDPNSVKFNESEKHGLKLSVKKDIESLTVTEMEQNASTSTVYLQDSGKNTILTEPAPGGGNSVTLDYLLSSGSNYYIAVDNDGSNYDYGSVAVADFLPKSTTMFDVQSNYTGSSVADAFSRIEGQSPTRSGTATVEFDSVTPLSRWDTAGFQADQHGGTIEVFVEQSDDGGSTWSIWGTNPIASGTDLSAIPGDQRVRFRVEFSRNDGANQPRLTLLSRQYTP